MDPGDADFPVEWSTVSPEFFNRPADIVARELVGKIIWRSGVGGGRLTEVEAYLPSDDPASHACRGKTKRNAAMFGPPGHVYVYLNYGIHVLLNIVCEPAGTGSAVLIRSFEPLGDPSVLWANRLLAGAGREKAARGPKEGLRSHVVPSDADERMKWLASGPGRVGQALDLVLDLDGLPLGLESGIGVFDDGCEPTVGQGGRVGISQGAELHLRFYSLDSRCVSATRGCHRGGRQ